MFKTGQIVCTAGVAARSEQDNEFARFVLFSLSRHIKGDWGDLCDEDRKANENALNADLRLLSAYQQGEQKIWIITEADRASTCVLFPDEY